MPTYTYKGVSKEHRDFMMKAYMASIKPQDPRGRKPIYHIDQKDSEVLKEKKRARVKKWLSDRKAEYAKTVDKLDAGKTLTDSRGRQFAFAKGKPVELEEFNSLVVKLDAMLSNPRDPFLQWEKAAEKKPEKKD